MKRFKIGDIVEVIKESEWARVGDKGLVYDINKDKSKWIPRVDFSRHTPKSELIEDGLWWINPEELKIAETIDVGDKVIVIKDNAPYARKGAIGVLVEDDGSISPHFDFSTYSKPSQYDGDGKWYFNKTFVRKYDDSTDTTYDDGDRDMDRTDVGTEMEEAPSILEKELNIAIKHYEEKVKRLEEELEKKRTELEKKEAQYTVSQVLLGALQKEKEDVFG